MDVRASSKAGEGGKVRGVPSTSSGQGLRLRKAIRFADRRAALRMTKPAGALLLMLILSAGARATTYYVSSSAGNDSNNGTSVSTPWQTIGHVNGQTFSPGDSILFKRGDVWNEGLATASSGSSGNPITFDAYGTGAAPNLTGYYSVPSSAWVHVTGNAWKAPVPATYTAINFCLFGSVWGEKVAAVSSNLTAWGDFYLASGFVYVFSPENPASYYVGAIVPMGLSNVPVINVNGQSWLTFQHLLVNWFDQYGVYVQGASDHLVFANMETDSMIPQGTQPLGFYVDESAPGAGDIKIYNSEAHLNYDAFRFDGAATAITMVNDKGYGNRDGALVDNTGAVSYSYCHFYASSLAVAGSTDVEYTSGSGPTAGAGNIAADTAPAVQVYQRYPAEVTLTVDDAGMTPGADTYYAGTVLPIADAAGVPVGAAITVGYPLAQTLIAEFQRWVNAGRDVTSHSMSHTYYTNTDALDIQYTGSGTTATLSISGKTLTITVTGASDSVSYNLAQGQTQGTILGLQQALAATGKFTTSYLTPCQGPYGTGCSAYTAAALLAQDLADVSGQDVRSAVYHLQLDVTRLTTDEITLSRQWMTTNLTGLPATPVYVYPGGYETTTMQGITHSVPYSGARGALKEDLGVKDTYADGFNVQNITSFGVNPSWMGLAPAVLNQKVQALVWKESVWGVPWGIFWHWNATTEAGELSATEVTNLIADFKASGATIQTNTGLVNWLLGGTQETGADGNYYYTFPATSMTLDFRPTKNSPVVDAGQDLGSAYALDLNGVNQNSYGSGWEIGAHVYQGYAEYGAGPGSSGFTVGTAGNYYVSPMGNDSNSCLSSAAPCLTIAHAESLSSPWDTINIAAGMYRLTSGTNGHYTSNGGQIAAKNNQTFVGPSCTPTSAPCAAILSGSVQLTSGQILGPDGDGNYYATGFTQQGNIYGYTCDTGWAGCNYPEDLYVNGSPYQHMNLSSEATLRAGTWWFNYSTNTVYLPSALTPTFVSGNTVEIGVLSTVFSPSSAASGVTVENFTIEEFASTLGAGGALTPVYGLTASPTSAINWSITNNYITLNHGSGILVGFGMQLLNNVLTANGQFGVSGGLPAGTSITPSKLVVQGNTVTLNNYAHVSPGFGAGGMKFGNTAAAVVRANIVENNIGNGIHFDVNSVNPLIDGNTLAENNDSAAQLTTFGAQPFSMMFNGSGNIPSSTGVIECGMTRLMDATTSAGTLIWSLFDTSTGTGAGQTNYNFAPLDVFLGDVYNACGAGAPALYTIGGTPRTALTNTTPTPACATSFPNGGCQPAKDLNSDGTGANLWFRNFVAAIGTHVNASGYSGTHSVPEYWEIWNEVDQSCQLAPGLTSPHCQGNFYVGTYAQLKRMTEDTRCLIKGVGMITATGETCAQVWATVTSVSLSAAIDPSASIVLTSAHTYDAGDINVTQNLLYCNDSPKSGSGCDGVGMHNAIDIVNTHMKPCQAPCNVTSNLVETDTNSYLQALLGTEQSAELAKPQWIGEGGYSGTGWDSSGTYYDNQMQQSFMLRYFLIAFTNGIRSISWYTYDISNTLKGNALGTEGWNITYAWLSNKAFGSIVSGIPTANNGCTLAGNIWSCYLTDNITNYLVMWDQSQSCSGGSCSTTNQGVPLAYSQYTDINGNVHGGIAGTAPIGVQPILLSAPAVPGSGYGFGIICEISELGCTIRNNAVRLAGTSGAFGIASSTSSGVQAYCNVVTEPSGVTNAAWEMLAANRGNNTVAPNVGSQIVSTGNYFHHNTVIWDTGTGPVGYFQDDPTNQPNLFANNTPPDYNTYHASSSNDTQFVYDNNNSGDNTLRTFADYQAAGADVHGAMDTIYTSGFPTIAITFPADQSSVENPITVAATASDSSGISKVEFYVDWQLQATVTGGSPYDFNWTSATIGAHTVAAMAYSNAGISSCNAVTLNAAASP